MTHPSTVHEPSVYHTLTGKLNNTLVVPRNQRRGAISRTSARWCRADAAGPMPATVTIPRPIGHGGVTYAGTYAGWLGPRHDPMEIREAPSANDRHATPVDLPSDSRRPGLQARRGLLNIIEDTERHLQQQPGDRGAERLSRAGVSHADIAAARRAFQVDQEPSGCATAMAAMSMARASCWPVG